MGFKKLDFKEFSTEDMLSRSKSFLDDIAKRRTVREFSDRAVPIEIIENCIKTAATAPSGANKQPWQFVIVQDANVKTKIREAAEKEEKEFYRHRATKEWLEDLNQFGTNWHKPFLEMAPYLIVVFRQIYDVEDDGSQRKNYYVSESVGIASGFLLAAFHNAGLATLTHTPSPMNFLSEILNRPANEKAFLLIPVGYPADDAEVPEITKKSFEEISEII
ncbi:MAG: nitroreductase family protein [Candidatus Marinimicrobia bacterium]|jgi:nitroreductase|nr:nitroreductase family protein [Candidatus Neomarinimicrobiota bacterium]MBT3675538.1 nitroreductase family protein [Candidatus Neomarinimicrobiota bacterium]MBT3763795.1 nitroreductase family protein [Candidatus Neomarinimicrobiota bacterium]MBT4069383.1 nitroreductase family protein [Candidatus Neomarinimicrobiota bacterium]MBT4270253.1 nitroreductase family protein [Candidatus Neomarinimicrobiota bacterium]